MIYDFRTRRSPYLFIFIYQDAATNTGNMGTSLNNISFVNMGEQKYLVLKVYAAFDFVFWFI